MALPAVASVPCDKVLQETLNYLRREIYKRPSSLVLRRLGARFFAVAPAGQDHFKQSTTRLYWIADKVIVPRPSP